MIRAAVLFALAITPVIAGELTPVPYPTGYRHWTHVKSMLIESGHPLYATFGGLHHLYANDKALAGYQSGRFPDGAVIVFDLLDVRAVDHTVEAGARKVVGVMHKDARRWPQTGGWGFEAFKDDSTTERAVAGNAAEACYGCHTQQKSKDFVFSAASRIGG